MTLRISVRPLQQVALHRQGNRLYPLPNFWPPHPRLEPAPLLPFLPIQRSRSRQALLRRCGFDLPYDPLFLRIGEGDELVNVRRSRFAHGNDLATVCVVRSSTLWCFGGALRPTPTLP